MSSDVGAVVVSTERISVALADAFTHITDPEEREALLSVARLEVARRRRRAAAEAPTKRCPKCSTTKPVTSFGASYTRYDGLQGYCRDCRSKKKRKEVS